MSRQITAYHNVRTICDLPICDMENLVRMSPAEYDDMTVHTGIVKGFLVEGERIPWYTVDKKYYCGIFHAEAGLREMIKMRIKEASYVYWIDEKKS